MSQSPPPVSSQLRERHVRQNIVHTRSERGRPSQKQIVIITGVTKFPERGMGIDVSMQFRRACWNDDQRIVFRRRHMPDQKYDRTVPSPDAVFRTHAQEKAEDVHVYLGAIIAGRDDVDQTRFLVGETFGLQSKLHVVKSPFQIVNSGDAHDRRLLVNGGALDVEHAQVVHFGRSGRKPAVAVAVAVAVIRAFTLLYVHPKYARCHSMYRRSSEIVMSDNTENMPTPTECVSTAASVVSHSQTGRCSMCRCSSVARSGPRGKHCSFHQKNMTPNL